MDLRTRDGHLCMMCHSNPIRLILGTFITLKLETIPCLPSITSVLKKENNYNLIMLLIGFLGCVSQ